jgi:plastocyanin
MRKLLCPALVAFVVIATAACTQEEGPDTSPSATVTVKSNVFEPSELRVNAGDTVEWRWAGGVHNVVSGTNCTEDGQFKSGDPVSGGTFERRFDTPGTYDYFCMPHCASDNMVGRIIVE